MTRILATKAVIRETAVFERHRPIVAELHARHLVVRLKGKSTRHLLAWDELLWICRHRQAEQLLRDRTLSRQRAARRIHANR